MLTPISQNSGFQVTYDSGLQTNNPGQFPYHGPSATPTLIAYNTGHYGDGISTRGSAPRRSASEITGR